MASIRDTCTLCTNYFTVKRKCIKCDYCNNSFHSYCAQIDDAVQESRQVHANFKWFCKKCLPTVEYELDKKAKEYPSRPQEIKEKTSKLIDIR